ncbi:MAG: hypothetical protein IT159_13120, partial [Bryobacterales bacterium]|nr:hypothetical protein [Bryobacterales bacterium]
AASSLPDTGPAEARLTPVCAEWLEALTSAVGFSVTPKRTHPLNEPEADGEKLLPPIAMPGVTEGNAEPAFAGLPAMGLGGRQVAPPPNAGGQLVLDRADTAAAAAAPDPRSVPSTTPWTIQVRPDRVPGLYLKDAVSAPTVLRTSALPSSSIEEPQFVTAATARPDSNGLATQDAGLPEFAEPRAEEGELNGRMSSAGAPPRNGVQADPPAPAAASGPHFTDPLLPVDEPGGMTSAGAPATLNRPGMEATEAGASAPEGSDGGSRHGGGAAVRHPAVSAASAPVSAVAEPAGIPAQADGSETDARPALDLRLVRRQARAERADRVPAARLSPGPAGPAEGASARSQMAAQEDTPGGGRQASAPQARGAESSISMQARPQKGRLPVEQAPAEHVPVRHSAAEPAAPAEPRREDAAPRQVQDGEARSSAVHAEPPQGESHPAAPRQMRFRLNGTGREPGVEVRVRDRAGELRVSVRTPDPSLSRALREGLPELVSRLGESGFDAREWRPASAEAEVRTQSRETGGREVPPPDGTAERDGAKDGEQGREEPDDNRGEAGLPVRRHAAAAFSGVWREESEGRSEHAWFHP